jgi:hypothetical protein
MKIVRESAHVDLPPAAAQDLWTDTSRWATFVDGFGHIVERGADWPEPGSKVVWQSGPAGRGRVTERVSERAADVFATAIFEDQLAGAQTLFFEPAEGGTVVTLELRYELQRRNPLRALADALFIRRALADALARTLRRFATEAAEQAAL